MNFHSPLGERTFGKFNELMSDMTAKARRRYRICEIGDLC